MSLEPDRSRPDWYDPTAEAYLDAVEQLTARKLTDQHFEVLHVDAVADSEHVGQLVVCEICGTVLNQLITVDTDGNEEEGERVWLHSQSWRQYDHDPIPTLGDRREVESACDFCGVISQPHWIYHTARIRLNSGASINDYGERWQACEHCTPFIEERDLQGLLKRVLRVAPVAEMRHTVDAEFRAEAYLEVWTRLIPTIYGRDYIGPRREPTRLNPRMMPKLQLGLMKFWRSAQNYFDGDVNLHKPLRASVPGVHAGDQDSFKVRYPDGVEIPQEVWVNHCQHIAAGIGVADMYWISQNFTRLSIMAGKDLNAVNITLEDLPSKFGFMVFAEPIGEIPRPAGTAHIRALTWTLVPQGIWMNLYIQGEDGDPEVDVVEMRAKFGYLICLNAGSGLQFNDEIPIPPDSESREQFQFICTILAAWYLMGQPGVASTETAPVDKKLARSYRREHGRALPDVQLVDLRKRPRRTKPVEGVTGRTLSQRVFRSGHWKRQPYGPKRSLRKMIYVSEYIAGPEGAPLKERRPVVKVVR